MRLTGNYDKWLDDLKGQIIQAVTYVFTFLFIEQTFKLFVKISH